MAVDSAPARDRRADGSRCAWRYPSSSGRARRYRLQQLLPRLPPPRRQVVLVGHLDRLALGGHDGGAGPGAVVGPHVGVRQVRMDALRRLLHRDRVLRLRRRRGCRSAAGPAGSAAARRTAPGRSRPGCSCCFTLEGTARHLHMTAGRQPRNRCCPRYSRRRSAAGTGWGRRSRRRSLGGPAAGPEVPNRRSGNSCHRPGSTPRQSPIGSDSRPQAWVGIRPRGCRSGGWCSGCSRRRSPSSRCSCPDC